MWFVVASMIKTGALHLNVSTSSSITNSVLVLFAVAVFNVVGEGIDEGRLTRIV